MTLDEFRAYKKIVETQNFDSYANDERAVEVHNYLADSGRLDESILGAIWKWIKKNFSPTSIKLHGLADEYALELEKEIRAEHDSKGDIADAIRNATKGGDISDLLKEKMFTACEGDADYKELASALINVRTYEVQSKLIEEYEGKFSPGSKKATKLNAVKAEVESEGREYHEEYRKANNKAGAEDKEKGKALSEILHKETERSPANKVIKTKVQATMIIEAILTHLLKHHQANLKDQHFDLTSTNAKNLLDKYITIVDKNYHSVMSAASCDQETAMRELRKKTVEGLMSDDLKDFEEKKIVQRATEAAKSETDDDTSGSNTDVANKLTNSDDIATEVTKDEVGEDKVKNAVAAEVEDVIADMKANDEQISKQKIKEKIIEDARKFFKTKKSRFSMVSAEKYDAAVEAFLDHYGSIVATDHFDFNEVQSLFKGFVKKHGYSA